MLKLEGRVRARTAELEEIPRELLEARSAVAWLSPAGPKWGLGIGTGHRGWMWAQGNIKFLAVTRRVLEGDISKCSGLTYPEKMTMN